MGKKLFEIVTINFKTFAFEGVSGGEIENKKG